MTSQERAWGKSHLYHSIWERQKLSVCFNKDHVFNKDTNMLPLFSIHPKKKTWRKKCWSCYWPFSRDVFWLEIWDQFSDQYLPMSSHCSESFQQTARNFWKNEHSGTFRSEGKSTPQGNVVRILVKWELHYYIVLYLLHKWVKKKLIHKTSAPLYFLRKF